MEFELSDPKPYDWKNQPTPKPYLNEFKIAQPLDDAARHAEPEIPQAPQPFSFGFASMANDGTQSRQESQDASGKVTGSYTIVDANGAQRIVEYYADDTGFHANIKSNEPGVEQGEHGGATYQKL
ncbi:cuticular protein-like protein [Euroglyphus maynei]|uniref:Cuticular protein-like protein n=1 Tax=Euroglyphus maynei TaxID=6958 RepID=A0A1Y3AZM9_EURMA|nr:cuticular protein-like protein [Euroglyphus maynei]